MRSYPWHFYSKKLREAIAAPHCFGWFTPEDAQARGMRSICGLQGLIEDGNQIALYWLVDPTDGMIVDARFQVFGQTALMGAAEVLCTLLIGKNYDQAKRMTPILIDKQVRDHPDLPAFPEETLTHLELLMATVEDAVHHCLDIPLSPTYVSPIPTLEGEEYPGWMTLSQEQKLQVLEEVVATEIRPYIELDAGGIEIVALKENGELVIGYQGACTSCFSAVGSTLSAIQHIVQSKVHPSLTVVPDLSALQYQSPAPEME